ncbi:hypothetical protein RAM_28555 [Amycolatopsis mediterranei S699]|uniref:Uncharacterized protein n=1 Tax=Amycolatopsis mediterranei (strain S699) TaxID=713604 RepID=A0A9R0UAY6_AMYMS|nr:hypothetical protein RAM_28555 [Amycolatopsis mediterranei S699]
MARARSRVGCRLTASAAMSLARLLSVRGLQRVCPGWRQREDLHVDALGVHRRDPGVAEVVETLEVVAQLVEQNARVTAVLRERLHRRRELGQVPVFFDRDQCHARPPGSGQSAQPPLSETVHESLNACRVKS